MHLVTPLISGVKGAENGMADVFRRGLGTAATYYRTFEGSDANDSGAPIQLDANGGAEVYVDQMVTVRVRDSTGDIVREFVAGVSAPAIEVRSQSFTGQDYDDGAGAPFAGTSKPFDLQRMADLWFTQNEAIDFQVLVNGVATKLPAALASFSGLFYNVKDPTYGAKGDGSTDDLIPFNAAAAAAQAADGGVVFLPPGDFVLSDRWDVPSKVSVLGLGPNATSITINSSTNGTIAFLGSVASTYRPFQTLEGIRFKAKLANSGDILRSEDANLLVSNCEFGDGVFSNGMLVTTGGTVTAGQLYIDACSFVSNADQELINIDDISVSTHISRCIFTPNSTMNLDCITMRGGTIERCTFRNAVCVSGTYKNIGVITSGLGGTSVSGCNFEASGGAAVSSAIHMGGLTSRFSEGSNVFFTTNKITGITQSDHRERVSLTSARKGQETLNHSGITTVVCDTDNFDTTVIETTNTAGAGAFTFDLGAAIVGHTHTVIVHAIGGGDTDNVIPGANAKGKTRTVSNGLYRAWYFTGFATTPGSAWSWIQTGQSEEVA